jgi:hypothetical protein
MSDFQALFLTYWVFIVRVFCVTAVIAKNDSAVMKTLPFCSNVFVNDSAVVVPLVQRFNQILEISKICN